MSATDPNRIEMLLLAEQQHRTRNAFQMVGGMLAREAAKADDRAAFVLQRAEAQLQAFALLGEELRAAPTATIGLQACLASYLCRLAAHLDAACLAPREIRLVIDMDEHLPLDERACRHLGLAVTELVLNAVKHAFPQSCAAAIGIAIERRDGVVRVAVADNGCGMGVPKAGRHQGLGYVDLLLAASGGGCECRSGPGGTRFVLSVPAS